MAQPPEMSHTQHTRVLLPASPGLSLEVTFLGEGVTEDATHQFTVDCESGATCQDTEHRGVDTPPPTPGNGTKGFQPKQTPDHVRI